MALKAWYFGVVGLALVLLAACSSDDNDADSSKPYVKTPAWPVLEQQQKLESYYQNRYDFDDNRDYQHDSVALFFNQFAPTSNIEPDKDALDQTSNDVKFTEASWQDSSRTWVVNQIADSENAVYKKDRPYRLWQNGQLQAATPSKNQALVEAIDDNVFSHFLGTTFVWDLGRHRLAKETDLSGKNLERYETTPEGLPLLSHASEWAKVDRVKQAFSDGARYYPLTLSVQQQTTVVEAVSSGNGFSLSAADVVQGLADLTAFINAYQEPNRFEFRFSNSPRDKDNHRLFISFDVGTQTAMLSENASDPTLISAVPFKLTDNQQVLEIDLQAISHSGKAQLGLSSLFNPVVIGPVNENGDSHFYYGKRYLKTTESLHDSLPVQVLFNRTAAEDIRAAFRAFRQEKYNDQL